MPSGMREKHSTRLKRTPDSEGRLRGLSVPSGDATADQEYELFAIRDAQRSEHFIGGDPHDGPMPMDYFMWLAKGEAAALLSILGSTPK